MGQSRLSSSFIVRVRSGERDRHILVHDLKSRQVLEFRTWPELLRYLQASGAKGSLK